MVSGKKGDALLGFFRNLTPQALFFACTLYYLARFDTEAFSSGKDVIRQTFALISCGVLWMLSLLANFSKFYEDFVSDAPELRTDFKKLQQSDAGAWRRFIGSIALGWRSNKKGLFEVLLVVLLTYATLVPVTQLALGSATNFLKMQQDSHSAGLENTELPSKSQ